MVQTNEETSIEELQNTTSSCSTSISSSSGASNDICQMTHRIDDIHLKTNQNQASFDKLSPLPCSTSLASTTTGLAQVAPCSSFTSNSNNHIPISNKSKKHKVIDLNNSFETLKTFETKKSKEKKMLSQSRSGSDSLQLGCELGTFKSNSSRSSYNFISSLSNKFKGKRKRTSSLCELNKISIKQEIAPVSNDLSNFSDQLVPKSNTNSSPEIIESQFKDFPNSSFFKKCNMISEWFTHLNEADKNCFLKMILDNCDSSQSHLFSLKFSQPHLNCEPNCCDIIGYLPKMISLYIFSFLDPVSLCRVSQVNKLWNELANDSLLWKRFCHMSKWRFSKVTEQKQLNKYKNEDGSIHWKGLFGERFRIKRNWFNGKCNVKTFFGHEGAVSCIQFDENRIVTGSGFGSIKVWKLSESNSDNSTASTTSSSTPSSPLTSTSTAQSSLMPYLNLFGHSSVIRCLHLDGINDILYSGSADHTIKVWHLSHIHPTWSRVTCKMTLLGHADTVRCLQVDEHILISGSYDNTLKIWDLKSGKCTNTLRGHEDAVLCLQFDKEKIVSGSGDRSIRIWNFNGECLSELKGHNGSITCLHFDQNRIISGSLDFDLKFWSIKDGQCVKTLNWITNEGHTAAIRCLQADNEKLVSCSDDKTIKIWNVDTGERYITLKNHSDGVTCLQFNDFYILSGSYDRTIKLWDFTHF